MKQNLKILLVIAIMLVSIASFTYAQMMGGNHDNSSMNKSQSMSKSCTMKDGEMADIDSKMNMMAQQNQAMEENFNDLEIHFDEIMRIDNIKILKEELQKHYFMMKEIRNNFSEHQKMCKMMSEVHSQNMNSTMGNTTNAPVVLSSQNPSGCCAKK